MLAGGVNMLLEIKTIGMPEIQGAIDTLELFEQTKDEAVFNDDVLLAIANYELPPVYEAIAMSSLIRCFTGCEEVATPYGRFMLANKISGTTEMMTDETTGYLNKRGLYRWADQQYDPKHNTYGVFVVDLAQFKLVNDVLGHAVGDEALRLACDTIASQIRVNNFSEASNYRQERRKYKDSDVLSIARFGGDEIAMVMNFNDLDAIAIDKVMKRVEDNLRETRIIMKSDDGEKEQGFGFRIGSIVAGPQTPLPFLEAIKLADAKQNATRTNKDR